jgi:tRNA (guanine-N7-)-methyltransferase
MGRRALRKIDPSLDLSRHLTTLDGLPRPWNAAALFARAAPLEVEVGSGKGLFLRSAAAARPEVDFLGVEIAPRYARFAAAGLARNKLTNAMVVVGDVVELFGQVLSAAAAAAVHIYFPDPWWKRKHQRRRIIQEVFVRDLARVLQPGGTLHFWTDVEEYFQTAVSLLTQGTDLRGPFPVAEHEPQHDLDYRSHFERRTRKHGDPVYRAEFRKAG